MKPERAFGFHGFHGFPRTPPGLAGLAGFAQRAPRAAPDLPPISGLGVSFPIDMEAVGRLVIAENTVETSLGIFSWVADGVRPTEPCRRLRCTGDLSL